MITHPATNRHQCHAGSARVAARMSALHGEPTRASVNVALDPTLLSRLAARVGAPRGLTVHKLVDLSRLDELGNCAPHEVEARVSHELAEAQGQAASEVQSCRFRPQPNVLISMRLRESQLGDAGIKAVAQALLLRAPLTLHMLSLAAVGACDAGIDALADALAATSAVQLLSLDLSSNRLTSAAGSPLAALLAAPKQRLEELRLSCNALGDAGAIALANGLVANQALTSLSLGHNGIGPSGVAAIGGALRTHSSLTALALPGNRLSGQSGCAALAELVAHARFLVRLTCGENTLGAHATVALAAALDPLTALVGGGAGSGLMSSQAAACGGSAGAGAGAATAAAAGGGGGGGGAAVPVAAAAAAGAPPFGLGTSVGQGHG